MRGVGSFPSGVAVSPDATKVYVANGDGSVAVIDATANPNAVVASIPAGGALAGVAVNPAGTRVYATDFATNTLVVIDAATNRVVTSIPVGFSPVGVGVSPSGARVYVANGDGTVSVIDTTRNVVVASVPVGAPFVSMLVGLAVNPSGSLVYVTNAGENKLAVIFAATNTLLASVPVGRTPYGVATDPTGTRIFVGNDTDGTVSVIDAATNRVVANVSTGAQPRAFGAFAAAAPAVAPSCEDQLAPLRQQIVLLQDQLATANAMIADLTSQNATLTSPNATLTSQNATLTTQNATLTSQNATLTTQNATLTSENATLASQNATLTAPERGAPGSGRQSPAAAGGRQCRPPGPEQPDRRAEGEERRPGEPGCQSPAEAGRVHHDEAGPVPALDARSPEGVRAGPAPPPSPVAAPGRPSGSACVSLSGMTRADPDPTRLARGAGSCTGRTMRLLMIGTTSLLLAAGPVDSAAQPDCITIEDFSKSKVGQFPSDWKPRKDAGKDVYIVMEESGLRFLRAVSRELGIQAAKQFEWDLDAYPVLAWSWRPLEFPKGGDERESKTNDSVLAVYLLVPYSRFAGPKAVKYVWSEKVAAGTRLNSNFGLTQARVVRTGAPEKKGEWVEERVPARDDFKRYFDVAETPKPAGIAVLTDSDDTGSTAQGDYTSFRACRR